MSVTPIRRVSDAELLQLALRRAGYVHPDEIMELDEMTWCLAASNAGLPDRPRTAVRCAVVALFGSPSLTEAQVPATPPAAGCSPASPSELVGRPRVAAGASTRPVISISQRKGGT